MGKPSSQDSPVTVEVRDGKVFVSADPLRRAGLMLTREQALLVARGIADALSPAP